MPSDGQAAPPAWHTPSIWLHYVAVLGQRWQWCCDPMLQPLVLLVLLQLPLHYAACVLLYMGGWVCLTCVCGGGWGVDGYLSVTGAYIWMCARMVLSVCHYVCMYMQMHISCWLLLLPPPYTLCCHHPPAAYKRPQHIAPQQAPPLPAYTHKEHTYRNFTRTYKYNATMSSNAPATTDPAITIGSIISYGVLPLQSTDSHGCPICVLDVISTNTPPGRCIARWMMGVKRTWWLIYDGVVMVMIVHTG